jgi:DNA processing protein
VVIVEAAKRSGSLITARFALEQGREVFAVPGSPIDPRAEGTNGLLKQGATLVTEAADMLAVVEPILGRHVMSLREPDHDEPVRNEPDDQARAQVVELLGPAPVSLDDLVRLSASSPALVRMVLRELELAGRIQRHGGGLVSLA